MGICAYSSIFPQFLSWNKNQTTKRYSLLNKALKTKTEVNYAIIFFVKNVVNSKAFFHRSI